MACSSVAKVSAATLTPLEEYYWDLFFSRNFLTSSDVTKFKQLIFAWLLL